MISNIYEIKAYDSIMCEYFCIGFIDFMLKGKSLFDYTNLFSLNAYEKNDEIILKPLFAGSIEKLKKQFKKQLFLLPAVWKNEDEKIFKKNLENI